MIRMIEFLIYLLGVIFITWYTPALRTALGTPVYLIILVFYLLGISKTAEFVALKLWQMQSKSN